MDTQGACQHTLHLRQNDATMKQRCSFELQFCELSRLASAGVDCVRIVVENRNGKRYAGTEALKLSFGTAGVPSLAFECGIYPSKAVALRLLGAASTQPASSGPSTPRRSLLGRGSSLNWQLLATAPLPLGQLAPATASTEDAASSTATSTTPALTPRGHSIDQASAASPFVTMSGGGNAADAAVDTDPLAAAAATLIAQQQHSSGGGTGAAGTASPGLRRDSGKGGRQSSGDESHQVSGLWVAGDSQVTRLTLQWTKEASMVGDTAEATVMDQEVVVIAKLLEARPSFSNLLGLRLSPSKTSLTGQAPPSPLPQAHGSGGGLTASSTSRQWDTVPVSDQGPTQAGEGQPRRVTFDAATPSALAPAAMDPVDAPTPQALGSSGGRRLEGNTPPALTEAAGVKDQAQEDEEAQEAAKRDFLSLILSTLASAPSLTESEAGSSLMAAASPMQLAAAASLPRAPSTKDLAVFAAAAGLPLEAVTQAAVSTRLSVTGTAGANNSSSSSKASSSRGRVSPGRHSNVTGSRNSSAHGSPQQAAKPPLHSPGVGAAAAATVAAATAAAKAAGLQAAPAGPAADSSSAAPALSPAAVSVTETATASRPAANVSAADRGAVQRVVTSTALVSSAAPPQGGGVSSGWEPTELAVATVTAAVPPGASTAHTPAAHPPISRSAATAGSAAAQSGGGAHAGCLSTTTSTSANVGAGGAGSSSQLSGPRSPLAGLSAKYNSLLGPHHHQQQQVPEQRELRSHEILAVMPGLAAAGSTAGSLLQVRQASAGHRHGTSALAASAGPGEQHDSLTAHSTATSQDVESKQQQQQQQQQQLPEYKGVTESWEAEQPPPPSPRLLAAAVGATEAATVLDAASPPPPAATANPAATATADVQEMLSGPGKAPQLSAFGSAAAAAAAAATFAAPAALQQQSPAVPTATGASYPAIPARGVSTENSAAPDGTYHTPPPAASLNPGAPSSRLAAVLAAGRQPSLGMQTTLSHSSSAAAVRQPSLSQPPASSSSASGALAGSSVASVLAPAVGAMLAALAAVLPAVAASTVATAVGLAVFTLRQLTWLLTVGWQLGGRLLLWAALAGPRAALWLAHQAWWLGRAVASNTNSSAARHSSMLSTGSATGFPAVQAPATSASSAAGALLLQRHSNRSSRAVTIAPARTAAAAAASRPAISPAAADISASHGKPSGSSANSSNIPPSLGGPGFRVWAPSAGRSTVASVTAAALGPLALLLQWPARTCTILFEVAVWVLYLMLGAPVMLAAGVLSYTGLLPARRSPGQPALSSVAAAGGFVAQGQIMPAPEADALPVPALPAAAAAAAPTGAVAVGLEAAGGQSVGGVGLPGSSVPLSATAVPEEHEVSGEELVSSSRGGSGSFIGPAGVAAAVRAVPPTPAPSLEAPSSSSGTQRAWSLSFLTAALSRLGSSSSPVITTATPDDSAASSTSTTPALTAAPPAAVGEALSRSNATTPRPLSGRAPALRLNRLAKATTGSASAATAYGATAAAADIISSSSSSSSSNSSSGTVSRSSSSSSSTGSGQLGNHIGGSWSGARRAPATEAVSLKPLGPRPVRTAGLVPPPGGAASSVLQQVNSSIDSFDGRGWWPAWSAWGAGKARPLSVTASPAAPASLTGTVASSAAVSTPPTPPPTPAGSFSRYGSNGSSTSAASNGVAGGSAQRSTAGQAGNVAAAVGAATAGGSHLLAAAAHVRQAFLLLLLGPAVWLWGALTQLGLSGAETAAWLVGWVLWWAVLPARLVWWGVLLPGSIAAAVLEGVVWLAEGVPLTHDDRQELH